MPASNPRLGKGAVLAVWLLGLTASAALWHVFNGEGAANNSTPARWLGVLGRVRYDDPDLVARVHASRIAVLVTVACAAMTAWVERSRVRAAVGRFLSHTSHPLNLAVLRIVVFYQAYSLCYFDHVARVASLPDALQFPPATAVPPIGLLAKIAWWPPNPLTPDQILAAAPFMVALCFAGMAGLFSRVSALLTALMLVFVWGAQQWYGKIDHHHHVVWFLLVLAASPSGAALSLDSLLDGWRAGRHGRTVPACAEKACGAALRACMLLMGVLYFFPGFHKVWRSGFDWFAGQSAYNQIYTKWHMIGGWLPVLRIDEYPFLVHAGAFATICFELSFVFLLFSRSGIYLAAAAGVTFHTALNVFMRHGFETLRNTYVMFVDWHGITLRLGRWLFPEPLQVEFDSSHTPTTVRVAIIRRLDWLGRINWSERAGMGRKAAAICAGVGGHAGTNARAYAKIAVRAPAAALVAPLIAVLSLLVPTKAPAQPADAGRNARRAHPRFAVVVTAAVLIAGNTAAGVQRSQNGWPLACYPLFDGLLQDHYDTLQIGVVDASGLEVMVVADDYRRIFGNMWNNLLRRVLWDDDETRRAELLEAIWSVLARHGASIADARAVRFYMVRSYIEPRRWSEPVGPRRLVYQAQL